MCRNKDKERVSNRLIVHHLSCNHHLTPHLTTVPVALFLLFAPDPRHLRRQATMCVAKEEELRAANLFPHGFPILSLLATYASLTGANRSLIRPPFLTHAGRIKKKVFLSVEESSIATLPSHDISFFPLFRVAQQPKRRNPESHCLSSSCHHVGCLLRDHSDALISSYPPQFNRISQPRRKQQPPKEKKKKKKRGSVTVGTTVQRTRTKIGLLDRHRSLWGRGNVRLG